nr:unnamed protein product [Callosobruchus chinensis]
MLYRSVK